MEGRGDVRIVTSDVRDIRSRLRGLRVSPCSSEEFAELLWEGIEDAAHTDEKPDRSQELERDSIVKDDRNGVGGCRLPELCPEEGRFVG